MASNSSQEGIPLCDIHLLFMEGVKMMLPTPEHVSPQMKQKLGRPVSLLFPKGLPELVGIIKTSMDGSATAKKAEKEEEALKHAAAKAAAKAGDVDALDWREQMYVPNF